MPRIPPKILDSIFYLYPDAEAAADGKRFGGTGFLVLIPSEIVPTSGYMYAVTNWHVACQENSVIRLNTGCSGPDILELGPEQWSFDPAYDIAVYPMGNSVRPGFHRISVIDVSMFLTKEGVEQARIGPGEDVFMIGRFIDHDGGPTNMPAARFGNIAINPSPIEQPNGKVAASYCIDLHSRTGYSGSPVFVFRTPGYDLEEEVEREFANKRILVAGVNLLALLGIHYGQFPERWQIKPSGRIEESVPNEPLIRTGEYVEGLSGMTCVLPAWAIMEVLNIPKLKGQRERSEEAMRLTRAEGEIISPLPENVAVASEADNPEHKRDFNRLPNAAARKREPKD